MLLCYQFVHNSYQITDLGFGKLCICSQSLSLSLHVIINQ